jgi:hypothetical protein
MKVIYILYGSVDLTKLQSREILDLLLLLEKFNFNL